MNKMIIKLKKIRNNIISHLENSKITPISLTLTLTGLIIIRLAIESQLHISSGKLAFFYFELFHTFFFFGITYLFFVLLLPLITKEKIGKIASVAIWGNILIILPPIIDHIISNGKGYWSFYEFNGISKLFYGYITFFNHLPEVGITYGTRAIAALMILFLTFYTYLKTKKILKTLYAFIIIYTFIFIMGSLPSWIAIIWHGFSEGFFNVNHLDVAKMFLTPVKIFNTDNPDLINALNVKMTLIFSQLFLASIFLFVFLCQKKKLTSLIRNCRLIQIAYHGGLLLIGMGLTCLFTDASIKINFFNLMAFIVILEAVTFSWIAQVLINDTADQNIDRETNKKRPLIKNSLTETEFKNISIILIITSLILASFIHITFSSFLLIYHCLAFLYSANPLRLKRFPIISSFVSASASIIIIFIGYSLVNTNHQLENLPTAITALLLITYTLSLPIKDFKDIAGDKKDNVYTIPVIFGAYWGKFIVGSSVFFSFILSIILLKAFAAAWLALLFGLICFWLILNMKNKPDTWISYYNIHWWIFFLTFIYGIGLVKIVILI